MNYLKFSNEKNLDVNDQNLIKEHYDHGFLFLRTEIGEMNEVRSLRILLKDFVESSENRRILKKYSHELIIKKIPFQNYHWEIQKKGKDFYDHKFGKDTFSANKIKELFVKGINFNAVLEFKNKQTNEIDGYCVCYLSEFSSHKFIHYAYPFYSLDLINSNFGMYMMTKSISYFKEKNFDYIYLGSVHETSSFYKLQFKGLEWWDEVRKNWSTDIIELKDRVNLIQN